MQRVRGEGILRGFVLALVFFALEGCGSSAAPDPWGGTPKKRVLTSFTPIYCFTANVAGDYAEVRCLMTTTGPHDFQPSIVDARLLAGADLFVVNGLGLEEFLDNLVRNAGKATLKICRAGEKIPADQILQTPGLTHYHGDKLVTHKGGNDPHVWLGIEEAKIEVEAIANALGEIDPAHNAGYRENAKKYNVRLDELKAQFADLKVEGGLVTFHDSFRYFCRSFGIPFIGTIRGVRGEDISPGELSQQAKEYRGKGVRLISIEPQYPKKVAELLRDTMNASGVKLVELDPLETGPSANGNEYVGDPNYYLHVMRQNLDHLHHALDQPDRHRQ